MVFTCRYLNATPDLIDDISVVFHTCTAPHSKVFSSSAPQPFHMEGQSEVEQYTIRCNWNASTCRTEMLQKL